MKYIFKALGWAFTLVICNVGWLVWNPISYFKEWESVKRNNKNLWRDMDKGGDCYDF